VSVVFQEKQLLEENVKLHQKVTHLSLQFTYLELYIPILIQLKFTYISYML